MKKSFIIVLHIGYWVLYLLLITLFMLFLQAGGARSVEPALHRFLSFLRLMGTFTIIPALISFYLFYGLLFDRYLSQKKIFLLGFVGLQVVLLAGFAGFAVLNVVTKGLVLSNNSFKEISMMVCFMSILALIHGIIALVMKGFITWYGDIKLKQQLQQQQFNTELALVKSQLNPHFLFNTINNIDVLITKDPEVASAYLNKLSDIMRFMLYETKAAHIPLQKELTYIEKYIDLQKIRSANHNFVQYTVEGNTSNWMIAPMLFIPFIENAFKHSVKKKADQEIVVRIIANRDRLEFYCENLFSENSISNDEAGGLGNNLIEKRLQLLYPGVHSLQGERAGDVYKIKLSIYNHEN
ncbi:hypothetical protein BH11BAC4_BH11BAC4_02300 [soil metagenome]